MARESTITYELVAQAAESIQTKGGKPTARAVRETLGSGSMATILKFLQQYLATLVRQRPNGMEDSVVPAIARAINTQITTRVDEATADAEARLTDLQSEVVSLIAEGERQTNELLAKASELEALRAQHATLTGRAAQIELEAAHTTVELANQRLAAELARQEQVIAELRLIEMSAIVVELEKTRADLVEARTQATTQHEVAAVATVKLEASEAARDRSEKQLEATSLELSGIRISHFPTHVLASKPGHTIDTMESGAKKPQKASEPPQPTRCKTGKARG